VLDRCKSHIELDELNLYLLEPEVHLQEICKKHHPYTDEPVVHGKSSMKIEHLGDAGPACSQTPDLLEKFSVGVMDAHQEGSVSRERVCRASEAGIVRPECHFDHIERSVGNG